MSDSINLHSVLTFSDLESGYKKLKKKKKYKDPRGKDISPRYISVEERQENLLKKFLDKDASTPEKRHEIFDTLSAYQPSPYNAYAISKGVRKGFRPLLVPIPRDRLIFDSLLPKYHALLEERLRARNLLGIGLVKKQKVSDILHEIYDKYISRGYCFALTIDYSGFFSNIDRDTLFKKFHDDFGDIELLKILKVVIRNPIEGGVSVSELTGINIVDNGIPQGLSFSPLLASYYALDIDDVYLSYPNVIGYRYIDDVMLFAKDEADLVGVFKEIEKKSTELKMKPHPLGVEGSKTMLRDISVDSISYLGVEISVAKGLQISESKFDEIINVVQKEIFNIGVLLNRSEKEIKKVYYSYMRGWLNHYEQIHLKPEELHLKIDNLIELYFKKHKVRKRFYKKYKWIVVSKNTELLRSI